MIYIVEIERKNGHTNVCHCSIRRIDTVKGEFLMPRSFEGDEGWGLMDYVVKIDDYIKLDKPKQIVFDTFGFSSRLYYNFTNHLNYEGYDVDAQGNIRYEEAMDC